MLHRLQNLKIYSLNYPLKYKSKFTQKRKLLQKKKYLNFVKEKNHYLLLTFFENFYLWRLNLKRRLSYAKQLLYTYFLNKYKTSKNYVFFKVFVKTFQEFSVYRDFFFKFGLNLNFVSKQFKSFLINQDINFSSTAPLLSGGYTSVVFFSDRKYVEDFFNSKEFQLINSASRIIRPIFIQIDGIFYSITDFLLLKKFDLLGNQRSVLNPFLSFKSLLFVFLFSWNSKIICL